MLDTLEFDKGVNYMKNRVSRTKNRLAIILELSFICLVFVGFGLRSKVLMYASFLPFIAGFILMLSTNRCPRCGVYFRGLYWSKSNAGYCRECGELIEFDDCEN